MNKLSTDLTNTDNDFLSHLDELDALAAAAAEELGHAGNDVTLLKCARGVWTANKTPVGADETFVALPRCAQSGYIRWEFNRLVSKVMGPMTGPGKVQRAQLGDVDRGRWAVDPDDKDARIDPWGPVVFELPMLGRDAAPFAFSTGTVGGRAAVAALIKAYADHCKELRKIELPIVVLRSSSHRHERFGLQHDPVLEIAGWSDDPDALKLNRPPAPKPEPSLTSVLEDEVPF